MWSLINSWAGSSRARVSGSRAVWEVEGGGDSQNYKIFSFNSWAGGSGAFISGSRATWRWRWWVQAGLRFLIQQLDLKLQDLNVRVPANHMY